jgi:hypothetical protein
MANALATTRPYVKVTGTIDEAVTITGQVVTILADPDAELTRSTGTGAILTVSGDGATVAIYDLSISNAPNNASGIGLVIPAASGAPTVSLMRATVSNNPGGGISTSGGTLTIERSTISGNTGGGISLSSTAFTIVNNFITGNGGPTGLIGGIDLATVATTGAHQLDFNTIANNDGAATVNTGINCGTVTMPIAFDSDIVYGNTVSSGGGQIGGSSNCSASYSDISGSGTAPGSGNINADPLFVSVVNGNYHLTAGSPCINAADPAATVDVDFDGDTRPQGSGRDIGADEFHP